MRVRGRYNLSILLISCLRASVRQLLPGGDFRPLLVRLQRALHLGERREATPEPDRLRRHDFKGERRSLSSSQRQPLCVFAVGHLLAVRVVVTHGSSSQRGLQACRAGVDGQDDEGVGRTLAIWSDTAVKVGVHGGFASPYVRSTTCISRPNC